MNNRFHFQSRLSIVASLLALSGLLGCSKEVDPKGPTQDEALTPFQKTELRVAFAKAMAKAVSNKETRQIIKNQSARQFDKDYDVLFSQIKDISIGNHKTIYSYIDSISHSSVPLSRIATNIPLLNFYVPKFPGEDWDAATQIPLIAVRDTENKLIAFNQNGEQFELDPKEQPNIPIIVIKDNERVIALNKRASSQNYGDLVFADGNINYYFLDNEYNGMLANIANRKVGLYDPTAPDVKVQQAFRIGDNCQTCAQRDWIYYNIDVSNGQREGSLNSNFEEAITAMRFENIGGFETIGGWDEGNYEFWINGFFGGSSPTTLTPRLKNLTITADNLFSYHTERRRNRIFGIGYSSYTVKVIDGVKDYTFTAPVKFVPWDMKKYGDTWAMTLEEYDPTVTEKKTYKHTTTVGTNWKFDASAGTDVKVGGSLGGSTTTEREYTTEYESQTGNDRLGDVVVSFNSPVITRLQGGELVWLEPNTVWTNELTTGTAVLSFETVRVR
ncbi:hypothetical protein KLP40_20740 [Hymenobacter sp. NST-14]|uniref:hypothetical protein n=1 Tax=Hymenobacter piscis TaxID=2839984 RepID=UPI001C00E976|nr:hypothetical protein [Hymenobacter piscis]MBT9395606.1 hypothetical protein [Hymenobacter piscis]